MFRQKMTVLALASLMTLSLPLLAEEETETADSGEAASSAAGTSASAEDEALSAMEERWRERDARYRELVERAKEVGVMLPDEPPWKSTRAEMMSNMGDRMSRHQAMMSMTPEERMAAREEHYKEMQAQAEQRGVELPDTPPWEARQAAMDEEWAKTQAVIEGMTDEERAACHAMHRRHMGGMMRDYPERPMRQGPGWGGYPTEPGWGGYPTERGWGPGAMGPGYGYGANPYGGQNFWDPNR